MKDTSIKGNGKSSIIRAPSDMPATFEEWRSQLLEGKGYLDIGLNTELGDNAGCDIIGTPLNKSNLLSDTTKSSLQLNGEDPTVNDALLKLSSIRAQPNGIATLNGSGKLAQMPTAADVGAIKLAWSTLINEESEIPNKYSFAVYITPGDVVSVCNYAGARSVTDIPEQVPGKLYVLPLRTDDQGRNDLMQEYHAATGNIWVRYRYYYSGNTWSAWNTAIHCSDSDGKICVEFGGVMHLCAGSQTWSNVDIKTQTAPNNFVSGNLFFADFKQPFRVAPKCIVSLSVGVDGPYWLIPSTSGPTTQRPQGVRLGTTISTTISTVTLSYIAIGQS